MARKRPTPSAASKKPSASPRSKPLASSSRKKLREPESATAPEKARRCEVRTRFPAFALASAKTVAPPPSGRRNSTNASLESRRREQERCETLLAKNPPPLQTGIKRNPSPEIILILTAAHTALESIQTVSNLRERELWEPKIPDRNRTAKIFCCRKPKREPSQTPCKHWRFEVVHPQGIEP